MFFLYSVSLFQDEDDPLTDIHSSSLRDLSDEVDDVTREEYKNHNFMMMSGCSWMSFFSNIFLSLDLESYSAFSRTHLSHHHLLQD